MTPAVPCCCFAAGGCWVAAPPGESTGGPVPTTGPTSVSPELAKGWWCLGKGGGGGSVGVLFGDGVLCFGGRPLALLLPCSFFVAAASTEGGSSAGGVPSPFKKAPPLGGTLPLQSPQCLHRMLLVRGGRVLLALLVLAHVGWLGGGALVLCCSHWLCQVPCSCPPCHTSCIW